MKVLRYAKAIGAAATGVVSGLVRSVSAHLKQIEEIKEMDKRNTENLKRAADALQDMGLAARKAGGSIEK